MLLKTMLERIVNEYINESGRYADPPEWFKGSPKDYQRVVAHILKDLLRTVEA